MGLIFSKNSQNTKNKLESRSIFGTMATVAFEVIRATVTAFLMHFRSIQGGDCVKAKGLLGPDEARHRSTRNICIIVLAASLGVR